VNATNDFFIRTSDDGHKAFVQEFLQRIKDNGRDDIYQDVYAGLYCVGCEAFKTPEELVDGKCPDHGTVPEWIEERNWFFRLSAYQDQLLALYDERPDLVLPQFRYNEARSFIEGGLRDFSISRATQTWGVPIPWDPEQVAYVWADALINYLSALSYAPVKTSSSSGRRCTSWRRTFFASTASTGRRCCSLPATSRRGSCSSTAT
jgi:methionyl-tRNA synthetase